MPPVSPLIGLSSTTAFNSSLTGPLRQKSEKLKELFDRTGMEFFRMETVEVDESMAWAAAAMAVSHLGALGCYRIPAGQLQVFVAIDSASPRAE